MLINFASFVCSNDGSVFTNWVDIHKSTKCRHPLGNHQLNRLTETGVIIINTGCTFHFIYQIPFLLKITIVINADFFGCHCKSTICVSVGIDPATFFNDFVSNKRFKATNVISHNNSAKKERKRETRSVLIEKQTQ